MSVKWQGPMAATKQNKRDRIQTRHFKFWASQLRPKPTQDGHWTGDRDIS